MADKNRENDYNEFFSKYKFCILINMKRKEEWLSSDSDYYLESSSWHNYKNNEHYKGDFVILENAVIIRLRFDESDYQYTLEYYQKYGISALNADFIRKVCILHAFYFKKGLELEDIRFDADGKITEIDSNKITSMIHGDLNLESGWYENDKASERVINSDVRKFINKSKSDVSNRLYTVAMYNFLIGLGRRSIYDKFINYWSSINAYYNFMIELYNNQFFIEYNSVMESDNYVMSEKEEKDLEKIYIGKGDVNGLKMLYYLYFYTDKIPFDNGKFSEISKLFSEGDEEKGIPAGKYKRLSDEYIENEIVKKYLDNDNDVSEKEKQQLINFILTISLPYKMRNRFIHGNETVPIVITDISWEHRVLLKLVENMEAFLNEVLPKSFPDDNNKVHIRSFNRKLLFDKVFAEQGIVGNDQKKYLKARDRIHELLKIKVEENSEALKDVTLVKYFYEWWPESKQRKGFEKNK